MSLYNRKHIICGYSGHAYVVLESVRKTDMTIEGYLDKKESEMNPYYLEYFGHENDKRFYELISQYNFILGVGDNQIRREIYSVLDSNGAKIISVTHPSAILSDTAIMGDGTFVSAGVIVNAQVTVGVGTILNTSCVIEHGCKIGNFSHIAPGAVLAGDVTVGENAFIGANSVVIEGVKIGSGVVVGAGSVIINDIPDHQKVVGNPGRTV